MLCVCFLMRTRREFCVEKRNFWREKRKKNREECEERHPFFLLVDAREKKFLLDKKKTDYHAQGYMCTTEKHDV